MTSRYIDRLAWGTDAGFYRLVPEEVLMPGDEGEIISVLARARKEGKRITFRAAGTSLSGQAITDSLLVVCGKKWERHEVLDDGKRIRVQPGVIGGRVNGILARYGEVTGMALKEYLDHRMDDNPALFVNHSFERLTPGGVRAMLKELAQLAGVEHVHPHKFRRTLATNLQRRGMPIQEVAHILGHEKLDTTMKYTVLNDDDLKNDYRKYTV